MFLHDTNEVMFRLAIVILYIIPFNCDFVTSF